MRFLNNFIITVLLVISVSACNNPSSSEDPKESKEYLIRMEFYVDINGEEMPPIFHNDENFAVTLPTGGPGKLNVDDNGFAKLETSIEQGKDTLSIVLWNHNKIHSFKRKNFSLLDYDINDGVIDLGKHEVKLGGKYVSGKMQTDYYDYKGNIDLKVNGEIYRLKENKFTFSTPSDQNTFDVQVEAEYYKDIDTLIYKSDLSVSGQRVTGLALDLTPTLYQTTVSVNFIGIDGSKLQDRLVPVIFRDKAHTTNSQGVFETEINETNANRNYGFTVNDTESEYYLPNFTSEDHSLTLINHKDYKINYSFPIYELGPNKNYTPNIRVGSIWTFEYQESWFSVSANALEDTGILTWEVTEKVSDSVFFMQTNFEGISSYYSAGDWDTSASIITGGNYLLKISEEKMKFEKLDESSRYSRFIEFFGYELNMYQPTTFNNIYTKWDKFRNETDGPFTRTKTTFADTKNEGIGGFEYRKIDYDSRVIEAKLKSFTY